MKTSSESTLKIRTNSQIMQEERSHGL